MRVLNESHYNDTEFCNQGLMCRSVSAGGIRIFYNRLSLAPAMTFIQDTRTTIEIRVVDISLGFEPWWGEIFRTRPDRPLGPLSLLFNEYRISFPGVRRPGRGVDQTPASSAEVKESGYSYISTPSVPSCHVTM